MVDAGSLEPPRCSAECQWRSARSATKTPSCLYQQLGKRSERANAGAIQPTQSRSGSKSSLGGAPSIAAVLSLGSDTAALRGSPTRARRSATSPATEASATSSCAVHLVSAAIRLAVLLVVRVTARAPDRLPAPAPLPREARGRGRAAPSQ